MRSGLTPGCGFTYTTGIYNSKGMNEVNFFKTLFHIQGMLVWWLFAKSIWPWLPAWVAFVAVPILMVVTILVNWSVGMWWERHDVFNKEADWSNERNPVLNGLDNKILKGADGGKS